MSASVDGFVVMTKAPCIVKTIVVRDGGSTPHLPLEFNLDTLLDVETKVVQHSKIGLWPSQNGLSIISVSALFFYHQ